MAKSGNALICQQRGFVVGDVIQGAEDGHIARLKIVFIGQEVVVFNELKNVNGILRPAPTDAFYGSACPPLTRS